MLRRLSLLVIASLLAGTAANGAIWPEEFFGFKRTSLEPVSPQQEQAVWEEYGFEEGERASYAMETGSFTATAWRFDDATGAMAAYQWQIPNRGEPSNLPDAGVEWDDGVFLMFGNYIFQFEGYKPTEEQLIGMYLVVPMLERSSLPTFADFVPKENRVLHSERYIIGPEALSLFLPNIPPSVAGFHFGVEAQVVRYQSPAGEMNLAVFSYPTPHIARERLTEFNMIDGLMVKRSGPLLAVVVNSPDADESERLLARVNYRAAVIWDEYSSSPALSLVEIVLTAFIFIGGLFAAALLLGTVFGGLKFLRFRRREVEEDPMILLHIDDK